ncbi:putative immunity protein [Kribbella sp. NPDC048915]|uniref:putative immunity protein n=1 Tax=Kribbella sp. NPDC048915 TaxID=3155148 RepID=UPI0033C4A4DA
MGHDEIPLNLGELRQLSLWTADCAERAVPLYEAVAPNDPRPREAISAVREFGTGGPRTKTIRTAAFAALKAAGAMDDPAAEAAARAAVGAAGSAYLHPFAAATQVKHIVASAQYAAYAHELAAGDPAAADAVIRWAIDRVPQTVREILARYPDGAPGRSRLGELHRRIEAELRRSSPS